MSWYLLTECTCNFWVACESRQTFTSCWMKTSFTFCVASTICKSTSIDTTAFVTDLVISTIIVYITLRLNFNYEIYFPVLLFLEIFSTFRFRKEINPKQLWNEFVPDLHVPWSVNTIPSGQIQATLRVGNVSVTTHSWFEIHGLFTRHGFWHCSSIHASFEAQS